MEIAIPKERREFETRVAASPAMVKKYVDMGFSVQVEKDAGLASGFTDDDYKAAGAKIAKDYVSACKVADVVMKVQRPMTAKEGKDEISPIPQGTILMANLQALTHKDLLEDLAKANITGFALEMIPRISRAQSMDILSSQSNLSGYKAVIDAVSVYGRAMPMMMTAAGTIAPAKVLVLGAGVAGLQAIATAKRLGAIVYAFDVRAAVKEQVESLGARFVDVDTGSAETEGGYAKELTEDAKKRQAEAIHKQLKQTDIVICTALIPGKKAPVLVTDAMLKDMRLGSVVADMAVEAGGNCEGSVYGKTTVKHGVTILGNPNIPASLASDASALLARNYYNFFGLLADKETKSVKLNLDDEIIKATCVTLAGKIMNPNL
ncbi:MAG: Re/Si-specific NAD(P)(+) transhydrogenase subunit alpha [Alphaproteobacteria bacterium]|nr:Re/Si-specific NAD(P)(+) transhydrogenase subunit alpha [Alphaproteobacteria bacterium]